MSYRDVYLLSTSISRENIDVDIVLSIELTIKLDTTTSIKTYIKRATTDEDILGIRKETQPRLLSLLAIGDSQ